MKKNKFVDFGFVTQTGVLLAVFALQMSSSLNGQGPTDIDRIDFQKIEQANSLLNGLGTVLIKPSAHRGSEVIFCWEPNSINIVDATSNVESFPDFSKLEVSTIEIRSCVVPDALVERISEVHSPFQRLTIDSDAIQTEQVCKILSALKTNVSCLKLAGRQIKPFILESIPSEKIGCLHLEGKKDQFDRFRKFHRISESTLPIVYLTPLEEYMERHFKDSMKWRSGHFDVKE